MKIGNTLTRGPKTLIYIEIPIFTKVLKIYDTLTEIMFCSVATAFVSDNSLWHCHEQTLFYPLVVVAFILSSGIMQKREIFGDILWIRPLQHRVIQTNHTFLYRV
jgi:hypothetical protein